MQDDRDSSSYLDFQQVITTNALVMHLMIRIISITTALVLDEGEARIDFNYGTTFMIFLWQNLQATRCGSRSWNVTPNKAAVSGVVRSDAS
jgi:hypothetical protein